MGAKKPKKRESFQRARGKIVFDSLQIQAEDLRAIQIFFTVCQDFSYLAKRKTELDICAKSSIVLSSSVFSFCEIFWEKIDCGCSHRSLVELLERNVDP